MFWTGIGCHRVAWKRIQPLPSLVRHLREDSHRPFRWYPCIFPLHQSATLLGAIKCSRKQRHHEMRVLAVDFGISVGLPILTIILQYIPEGHRFNILEDIGCYPHTYNTWVGFLILGVPPVLIGIVSAIYAVRSIVSINRRRTEFNELLSRHFNPINVVDWNQSPSHRPDRRSLRLQRGGEPFVPVDLMGKTPIQFLVGWISCPHSYGAAITLRGSSSLVVGSSLSALSCSSPS